MQQAALFVRRHWITLLLLVAALIGVRYAVQKFRPVGAMTPLESQAMDMNAMTAPVGTLVVGVEDVMPRPFSAQVTYTGTVAAFNDEEIVARVQGRVTNVLVYPGQKVAPGQLVARLDTAELASRADEAADASIAARSEIEISRAEVRESRAAVEEARARVNAAEAGNDDAKAQIDSARQDRAQSAAEVEEAHAGVEAARANDQFWQSRLVRDTALFREKAISSEELQQTQSQARTAAAGLTQATTREQRAKASVVQAEAAIRSAQAKQRQARSDLKATHASLQAAIVARSKAKAGIARSAAQTNVANAQRRTSEVILNYTRLTSARGGIVTERLVSPGTLVEPGQPILRIKQIDRVRLQASVPGSELGRIRVGTPIRATLSKSRAEIRARVTSVFSAANPETRTVTVEAVAPNPESRFLPGQYIVVVFETGAVADAISVPSEAVMKTADGRSYVWVVEKAPVKSGSVIYTCPMHPEVVSDRPGSCPKCGMDLEPKQPTQYTCPMHPEVIADKPGICPKCKMDLVPTDKSGDKIARQRFVTVGPNNGQRTLIRSGIEPGETVIISNVRSLHDGLPVKPGDPTKPSQPSQPTPPGQAPGHQHSFNSAPVRPLLHDLRGRT